MFKILILKQNIAFIYIYICAKEEYPNQERKYEFSFNIRSEQFESWKGLNKEADKTL